MSKWISFDNEWPALNRPVIAVGIYKNTGKRYFFCLRRNEDGQSCGSLLDDSVGEYDMQDVEMEYWLPTPRPPKH